MNNVDILETRTLFAADPFFTLTSKGTLIVHGTDANESIVVECRHFKKAEGIQAIIQPNSNAPQSGLPEVHQAKMSFESVKRIQIDGGGGDDWVGIQGPFMTKPATLLGGEGDDRLYWSTTGSVVADGGNGNDMIGSQRTVVVLNNKNRDVLNTHFGGNFGGSSNTLLGGDGNDTLLADDNDVIDGGAGTDTGMIAVSATLKQPFTTERGTALCHDFYGRLGATGLDEFKANF